MQTLAIVGASLAGLSAARAARAQGFTGRLIIIGDEQHRPYDRPPLSKDFLLGTVTAEDLFLESDADELEAEWLLGTEAASLDAVLADHPAEGRPRRAGGRHRHRHRREGAAAAHPGRAEQCVHPAHPRRRPEPCPRTGARQQDGRHRCRLHRRGGSLRRRIAGHGGHHDRHQARAVRRAARNGDGRRGGRAPRGQRRGARSPLPSSRTSTAAKATSPDSGWPADGYVAADVVVVGIGAEPNTGWLEGSGLELRRWRRVRRHGPHRTCRASWPWGTAPPGSTRQPGTHRRVEHWTGALERAALAVEALLDADAVPKPAKPHYFWSDQYGVKLQFAGHSAGYDRLEIEAGDAQTHSCLAVYYRGDVPVAVLGMNQPRLFTKWRRSLGSAAPGLPAGYAARLRQAARADRPHWWGPPSCHEIPKSLRKSVPTKLWLLLFLIFVR